MTQQDLPKLALLVVALLMLLKAGWAIINPAQFKRMAIWWSGTAAKSGKIVGVAYAAIGFTLWVIVMFDQPLTNWLLTTFALLFAWAASLAFRPTALQAVIRWGVIDRTPTAIRILYLSMAVLAGVLIWIAVQAL